MGNLLNVVWIFDILYWMGGEKFVIVVKMFKCRRRSGLLNDVI